MRKEELAELIGPWQNVELCARHMADHPDDLPMLLGIALEGSAQVHWHAAWVIDKVNSRQPQLIRPFVPLLYKALKRMDDFSRLRHVLKVISTHPVPAKQQAFLFDFCMNIFLSENFPVAVRAHAIQNMYNIACVVPGLKQELTDTLEHELSITQSAGIRARAIKILKLLADRPTATAARSKNL